MLIHIWMILGNRDDSMVRSNTVIWLLEHGANPECACPQFEGTPGIKPLDRAADTLSIRVVNALLNHGASLEKSNTLHNSIYCINEWKEMVDLLLCRGADIIDALEVEYGEVNPLTNKDLLTPLQMAASLGFLEHAKYLIHKGANPNKRSRKGLTALRIATRKMQWEMVAYLERESEKWWKRTAGPIICIADGSTGFLGGGDENAG